MTEMMTVIDMDSNYVYLNTNRAGECSECSLHGACNITGTPDLKLRALKNKSVNLKEGDIVLVELPKVSVSKLSFLVYGIPLIIFMAISIILNIIGFSDILSFLIGFSTMLLTYVIIGIYDKKKLKDKYLPKIIEKKDIILPEK
ncbi:SoxR reducing system RseC family protein [Oceanotoga sp. DSM 15011]|uniref:RseC/MucC-like positive regulator of sigma(E) n=1 Tax=Oceanotoga teriensis TaxID=515440 RepID=A0AA45HJP1_9BACT|nr:MULTISPECIES: SoxR reducing system RseC family protein [Oceanotoga]MDN5343800.1 sigma-E factor negative regulatory protein RseC [Oceanotoga sp.]MDO7975561.1 SoxR reducing system RseC family protein [Oceanotoga teriensis]PWJ96150.1 RseC/MucC-like positive regulator of sigma(E) [Oceanotoga teriensis]UYO99932.1 SoxR reducing system RseC family protein [Oceanotoga sp. DSM 15011]